MSLEDCVYVATPLSVKDTLYLFINLNEEDIEIQEHETNDDTEVFSAIKPNKYILHALNMEPEDQMLFSDWIGILPTVNLIFRLNKFTNIDKIEDHILGMILKLLDNSAWDVALLLGCDIPLLVRKSGNLVLQREHEYWTTDRLKTVTIPYSMEELKLNGD